MSLGSKAGFNLGKGYSDLGKYSTHGGPVLRLCKELSI